MIVSLARKARHLSARAETWKERFAAYVERRATKQLLGRLQMGARFAFHFAFHFLAIVGQSREQDN